MLIVNPRNSNRPLRRSRIDRVPVPRRSLSRFRTSRGEQFGLTALGVLFPLQDHIPSVAGLSVIVLLIFLLAGYIFVKRMGMLRRTWNHPVFLAAYSLLLIGVVIESMHPNPSYDDIGRFAMMIGGAVVVAVLCRDRRALQAGIYGLLFAGVLVSFVLFATGYGVLNVATTAASFQEASQIRGAIAQSQVQMLWTSLNVLAFHSAVGSVMALAMLLAARSALRRLVFLGVLLFCMSASFLAMSRGGTATLVLSCASVMFAHGFVRRPTTILIAGLLGASVLIWLPDTLWSRLTFSLGNNEQGKMEARARVYTGAVKHLPEYALVGVGSGNFWGSWGRGTEFAHGSNVLGAHNIFFQVTIYWGFLALAALLAVIWQVYKCLPKPVGNNELALCLLGICVSMLSLAMIIHNIYAKEFCLGLGMVVGARLWIWPKANHQVRVAKSKSMNLAKSNVSFPSRN